jgi:hypothetical protein
MARMLIAEMPLDSLEDEVMFTIAALKADEDAADLLPMTADWLTWIDQARVTERMVRQAVADADAARIVANARLDQACIAFADDLLRDVDKDRSSPRWLGFFKVAPNLFIKQPLSDQVLTVRGWLELTDDPILETHREALTKRSSDAQTALVATQGLAMKRGTLHQQREQLAKQLTEARDALRSELGNRARERKLGRSWPDTFFRVER